MKYQKMALKGRLRSQRSKRFDNVVNDYPLKSQKIDSSSFDCDTGVHIKKEKVREEFSAKSLINESGCHNVANDHIYSSGRSSEAVNGSNRERKMSEENCEKGVRKKCFSKNAVMARLNRERKKKYLSSLETEKESLQKENNEIYRKLEEQSKKMSAMRREILYLKGLVSNSKEIGQIIRNLKAATEVPVTSSMSATTQAGIENKFLTQSSATEQEIGNQEIYQSRTRSVNSGYNYPILDKDINLGSCSDNTQNDLADLENYPFDFENNSYDISPISLSDERDFSDFTSLHSELESEECVKFNDLSKDDTQVGICLHVNQKRISVEICSICNSKAGSFLQDLPEEAEDEENL